MKLHTETKHLLELSDAEINRLFDEIANLSLCQPETIPTLLGLKRALFSVRHGV